jgi:hypothetical protein
MPEHPSVEDFQLTREYDQHPFDCSFAFMNPFVKQSCTWSTFCILTEDEEIVHEYAVSVEDQAYIIRNVQLMTLVYPNRRLTRMHLSQMIVDNWVAAGGDPADLQSIGVAMIENADARESITRVLELHQMTDGELVITSESLGWEDCLLNNPFMKSAKYAAAGLGELAGVDMVVERATLSVSDLAYCNEPEMSMVIELMVDEEVEEPPEG